MDDVIVNFIDDSEIIEVTFAVTGFAGPPGPPGPPGPTGTLIPVTDANGLYGLALPGDPGTKGSAHVVADARGQRYPPQWEIERSVAPRFPGFAQWVEDPARAACLVVVGDSTGDLLRWPFRFMQILATMLPTVKIVYHKSDYISDNPWFQDPVVYNAATWTGEDPYMPLPGTAGISMVLPASGRYCPPKATKFFVGARFAMASWLPASNMGILSQNDSSILHGRGTTLRVGTDGRIGIITSPDGDTVLTVVQSSVSITTIPGFTDGMSLEIAVEGVLSTGVSGAERSYIFLWRPNSESAWTQLGATVTAAGASNWYGSPRVPWEFGAGGSSGKFAGKFYGVNVRQVDRRGPDILPRLAQQWDPTTPNLGGAMVGGPVLHIVNSSWPQHGLQHFTPRDDTTVPGTDVFTRGYGYLESAVPLLPVTSVIINTGHNENFVGPRNARDWRRLVQGLLWRTDEAEIGALIQNPTLRDDGPVGNIYGKKRDHDLRNVQATTLTNQLGIISLDGRQGMLDYVRNGSGPLSDLMQDEGQHVHPDDQGSAIIAQSLISQTTFRPYVPGLTP